MSFSLSRNLRDALRWATIYIVVYSAIVILIALIRGAEPFERANTSLLKVLAAYWSGGVGAGLVVGLLLPLGRSWVGAALLGALAGVPVAITATIAMTSPEQWSEYLPVSVVVGLMLGTLFGIATKIQDRPR